jgi:hypothetical protein
MPSAPGELDKKYDRQHGRGAGELSAVGVDTLPEQLGRLPAELSGKNPRLLSGSRPDPGNFPDYRHRLPGRLFHLRLLSEIMRFSAQTSPPPLALKGDVLCKDLKNTLGHWLKAQLIMGGITFGELLIAFILLKLDYAILLALASAVIDSLPVFGAGTVLLPWAAVELLTGNYPLGIGLVITYGAVTLIRQCIQAKLVGDQLGLHPEASLIAVYFGYRAMGVWGMILLPILFITVKQLNDRGVLSLLAEEEAPTPQNNKKTCVHPLRGLRSPQRLFGGGGGMLLVPLLHNGVNWRKRRPLPPVWRLSHPFAPYRPPWFFFARASIGDWPCPTWRRFVGGIVAGRVFTKAPAKLLAAPCPADPLRGVKHGFSVFVGARRGFSPAAAWAEVPFCFSI